MTYNNGEEIEKPYKIVAMSPSLIQIEILDIDIFKKDEQQKFKIGGYVQINDTDNKITLIAMVQSYKTKQIDGDDKKTICIIDTQPIGCLKNGEFKRNGHQITIPPSDIQPITQDILKKFYKQDSDINCLTLGSMNIDNSIRVHIDGDKFFSKHIAIVGSTGSGKSCTIAKILQEAIQSKSEQSEQGVLNNSHIIIFDIHGEYATAFPDANILTENDLVLPYWLMNSEELEEMFIESHETNSHNQTSQFRHAVIENKKRHNTDLKKITYDTPVYFSLSEIFNYISNMNNETKGAKDNKIKLRDGTEINNRDENYFSHIHEFAEKKPQNISGGAFNGEFDRFIRRLEIKMQDERLSFILKPHENISKQSEFKTHDLEKILKQIVGYKFDDNAKNSNVTIINLSGMPFEETSIIVSLISRILFQFSFYFKQLNKNNASNEKSEVPILVVYEEAHLYAPNSNLSKYKSARFAIEKIAKEGRKYGISLMIASQRPSEISETIFSQCNNFVAMRLTNPSDQNYVKRLLPDTISNITDNLPSLDKQEAIIIGDAITIPTVVKIDDISQKPRSVDINVLTEWKKNWADIEFSEIINLLQKTK